ncbi:MAG: branched-chain amino acid ABC transporter permease [Dehalococcoidia bacterium]|jgi:branched-chain amino acid transport system permease protein
MDFSKINWKKNTLIWGIPLVLLVVLGFLPAYGWDYGVTLFSYFLMYIILSVAWTIFSGATGYISLASSAFFGVGIYAAALLGESMPLIFVIIIGGAASFVLAFIFGAITLRLRGIYFAMFTFGLVLLFKELIYYYEINIEGLRGRFVVLQSNEAIFYYLLGIFIVTVVVAYLIRRSRFGLALQAIGQNEEAAAHTGVNVTLVKIFTFAVSATFMGAAGVVMATKWTYVDPGVAFNLMISFTPVLMAIFGGMGNIYGPIVGAVLFAYIQEVLTTGALKNYYMLIFGSVLICAIVFMPNGLMGVIQKVIGWIRKGRKGGSEVQNASP